ncbi:MAG: hypothetical protein JWO36_5900 [Myxococcales bacterium]|nr:hypothetical protein [Myxococcales bacterium]
MSLETIFGGGKDLDVFQMAARAFVLFFVTLMLVRIAGMRAFGRKSSFDTIIVIMLGAVLSRAVTGASPAIPTVVAGSVFVIVHRVLAMITARIRFAERIVKGERKPLYHHGSFEWKAMNRCGISRADLEEAVRSRTGRTTFDGVAEIDFETSGDLTVITEQPRVAARKAS